jgi:hypothetical protein
MGVEMKVLFVNLLLKILIRTRRTWEKRRTKTHKDTDNFLCHGMANC